MIKVGIVGATGYTGIELIRLLSNHPDVQIKYIVSRSEVSKSLKEVFPFFKALENLCFVDFDLDLLCECDLVFFATPNGTAMKSAERLLSRGVKVIDLSADFRLKTASVWESWYGETHVSPQLLNEAVYGLPEINREKIKQARLVANPGCYPTAVQLGWLPLLKTDWIDFNSFIADVKSGVSGAGRVPKLGSLYAEVSENFKAYGLEGHRHLPEIAQGLSCVSAKEKVNLIFTPHLLPINRGILATLYVRVTENFELTEQELREFYAGFYQSEPFVEVLSANLFPETRNVRGTNFCEIGVRYLDADKCILIVCAIDNLVKGAAGQAVQNMNLLFGLDEKKGLSNPVWAP